MLRLASFYFKLLLAVTILVSTSASLADDSKRSLEHSDYDHWNTIGGSQISNDGKWVIYSIESGNPEADSKLVIRERS